MGLKRIVTINEGPVDFMRGMASATGQKVAQSRPVQAIRRNVNDVVQAGRTASQLGDLSKVVMQLSQILKQRQQLKAKLGQQQPQPSHQQASQQQASQQQASQQQASQQRVPADATPAAFRTLEKPKGRMGQHGFEYTFNSFMQDVYGGEQLNEGVWDFVKGAGAAASQKIGNKIQSMVGNRGAWLTGAVDAGKEIVAAGRNASAQADMQKAQTQLQQLDAQAQALMKQVVDALRQMGDAAPNAIAQLVRGLPQQDQQAMANLIRNNLNKGK